MSDETSAALSETEQVAILAAPTPSTVQAWRQEDPARRIYSTTGFEAIVPDDHFAGADMQGDARLSAAKELRNMLADTGLAPAEVSGLFNRSHLVREAGKSAEAQRKETRQELKRVFGDAADDALLDARRLIGRDPRFSRWIEKQGLGNDVETIVQFAKAARSQRAAGRLK